MNPELLLELANTTMPYGRYQGVRLCDLPEPYVVWYHTKGFPSGHLGELLGLLYEIKVNGLEPLLEPLKKPLGPKTSKTTAASAPLSTALEKAKKLREECRQVPHADAPPLDSRIAKELEKLRQSIKED